MARCWERIRNAYPSINCRLLLQIHDELLWEVAEEDLDSAAGKFFLVCAFETLKFSREFHYLYRYLGKIKL